MTPNDVDVLIHYAVSGTNHERAHAPAVIETTMRYLRDGIFGATDDFESGYRLTDRGEKFLQMILDTPYPEMEWLDPRKPKALPE